MGLLRDDPEAAGARQTNGERAGKPARHRWDRCGPLVAEGAGFEPAVPYSGTPLFESGTINHSDTLPPRSIARFRAIDNHFGNVSRETEYPRERRGPQSTQTSENNR